jgi:hypothetical protein
MRRSFANFDEEATVVETLEWLIYNGCVVAIACGGAGIVIEIVSFFDFQPPGSAHHESISTMLSVSHSHTISS